MISPGYRNANETLDNKTKEERSRNMAAVRNTGTDLELAVRRELWRRGLRYRLNYPLPGRPDIVFPGRRIAIFCDGCFWHGCPEHGQIPVQNRSRWQEKIQANKERDARVTAELREMRWVVLRYWGCEIKGDIGAVVEDVLKHFRDGGPDTMPDP